MITPDELKEFVFFRNLSDQHRAQIAKMARAKDCEADAVVFRQGQDSSEIYFVLGGEIGLHVEEPSGASDEVVRLGRGEFLGWSPVLGRHAMTATARAVSRARLAILNVNEVVELCEKDPHFGLAFMREIASTMSDRFWTARRNLAHALSHRPLYAGRLEGSD